DILTLRKVRVEIGDELKPRVTRLEIADAIGAVFEGGGASQDEILAAAVDAGTRPEVIDVLRELPPGRYGRLNHLWEVLSDIPVGV
ncbi:MAG: hypothetical protein WEA57_00960, partial [Acidimicrobiia bacterium]